jgi:hypothetical protein
MTQTRAQILNNTERLTFAGVTARIQQEESRRVAMSVSDQNPKSESHAFTVMNPQAFKGKKGTGQRCTHCNRDSHLREGCWNLYPHLKPKWKGQGGGGGRNQGEPPRKAYLAENLDSSQGEKKGNGAVRGSGSIPTELYRLESLESTVNRLTQLLGQPSLMGQPGSVNSINFSNSVTAHSEMNNPNETMGSKCCTAQKTR